MKWTKKSFPELTTWLEYMLRGQLLTLDRLSACTLRCPHKLPDYHQDFYTWTRALRTLFVYAEFTKKKGFQLLTVGAGSPAHRYHCRQKVWIPECNLTGRRFTITLLPVRSNSSAPCTPLKIRLPKHKTRVNLRSASFFAIMHLHEGLTHIQSQIKPWLLFGTLTVWVLCRDISSIQIFWKYVL